MLFVFIRVWTLDSVHARLRLPFLTLQEKHIGPYTSTLTSPEVTLTCGEDLTSVYIHSSEKSCFVQKGRMVQNPDLPSLFKLYEVWSVGSAENH